MPLSWNEIRRRAIEFSRQWEGVEDERAEAKSFWDGFFSVFGVPRRRLAAFEAPVKKLGDRRGYIDLFWKGNLLVEHKSRGKDLDKAYTQAIDYFPGIKDYELPKFVLVSDFERFRLYDLEDESRHDFTLAELQNNIHLFGFIAGYAKREVRAEDPANLKAAELMGKLHDRLAESGYGGHPLEVFLVRVLFCLFADDTGVFEKDIFTEHIMNRTSGDGSDLGMHLSRLFEVLDTPDEKRSKTLDENIAAFPHINGRLFAEPLPFADFDAPMRTALLECCHFDWSRISPAIFGALFQSVMDQDKRRDLGAHYTSETNILKVIGPLFLDDLKAELESILALKRGRKKKLEEFHAKIAKLHFLDPACGCGNFLVVAYRELRLLEIKVIKALFKDTILDVATYVDVNVDQFHGIEIEEFPARIAETAMWLTDHQMNVRLSEEFGMYFVRLPLTAAADIRVGNALEMDWSALAPGSTLEVEADTVNVKMVGEDPARYGTVNVTAKKLNMVEEHPSSSPRSFDYILGNPPFVGSKFQSARQRGEVAAVFNHGKGVGILDYVTAWYAKAAELIRGTEIKCAFVSTNSISQGEQVGVLWRELFRRGLKIHFAHRTFNWSSEAPGKAHVHVVIIGFANFEAEEKTIFDYEDINGEPHAVPAGNINPYLVDGSNVLITNRSKPLCDVPRIKMGNKPIDGGNYLFSDDEKRAFIMEEPASEQFFRQWFGAEEFINRKSRWCLWLGDCPPHILRKMPKCLERVAAVKRLRLASTAASTRKLADKPTRFHIEIFPESDYLLIPSVSSERRRYIPIGFMQPPALASNLCLVIPDATIYHFGVLQSAMHMAWMKAVCGRLKSDYRYSNKLVYNNYPWPNADGEGKRKLELAAKNILTIRGNYPDSSLADLYDPLTMPSDLLEAHDKLDHAVDLLYRKTPFASDTARLEHLFALYAELTGGEG